MDETRVKSMDPESRINRLVGLSMDLVEKRLREGTATSAEVVHFLKLANKEQKLREMELESKTSLMNAKVDSIKNAEYNKVAAEEALMAMKEYSPSKDY